MGTKTDKAQGILIRFLIDQNQIRLDMAIPMVVPIAGKLVILVFGRQRLIKT